MSVVSEQISELSAELLLKALADLSDLAFKTIDLVYTMGTDAARGVSEVSGPVARALLVKLIDAVGNRSEFDRATLKAIDKLEKEALKGGSTPRQLTILSHDLDMMENWLKEQDVLYVAASAKKQDVEPGAEKSVILFLEKDAQKVYLATALLNHEKGFISELPPEAFLFVNDRKDITVVDGLDVYELEVLRELAPKFGLTYSTLINGVDAETGELYGDDGSFKILVSKNDAEKMSAVMQQVVWSVTGEYKDGIKEKVKERVSIKKEIQDLLAKGVPEGQQAVVGSDGSKVLVDNAKYIVNSKTPNQYIKLTHNGFAHFKFGKDMGFVSKDDPEYSEKIQKVLGEFPDAVVFDASEWVAEGLDKANLRAGETEKKLSVFPVEHDFEKENEKLRKAKKKEEHKPLDESTWLFHNYDTEKAFSEVVEVRYDPSEPLERNVSVHYEDAVKHSEKYKYLDVEHDEKAIDNIILSARERSMGNDEFEQVQEKEESL